MSRRATPEQRAAIEHPLEDACVTAGAGSGKTTVLVGRFLHLVKVHGISPRRIAALTFTEKAAAEMRRRIAAAFESDGDEESRASVQFASISTMHSFCARLLRQHAVEAQVDPAFEVLDATSAALLREEASERAGRRLRADDPDALGVLVRLGTALDGLWPLVESLRGAGRDPAAFEWRRGLSEGEARREVRRALEAYEAEVPAAAEERVPALLGAAALARAAAEAEGAAGVPDAREAVRTAAPGTGKKQTALRDARDRLVAALDAIEGAVLDDEAEREGAPRLRRVLARLVEAYTVLKQERSALDFQDLEARALVLLESLAARGRPLEPAPEALLVDELQDVNPVQARLLSLLRASRPGSRATVQFSVGDAKQSIYRFRGADVRVIQEERERVGASGRHVLPDTFRASPPLVAALNGIHAASFGAAAAGVDFEPMRASAEFRDPPRTAVEVLLADVGAEGDAAAGRRAEADLVARRIKDLVESKVLRTRTGDAEPRPISWGDCAVLLRAATSVAVYEEALRAHGVPFHTHKGRGFFLAEEVEDLLNVLRVVHDPQDAYAVACAATGPAFGAGDADLLRWFGRTEAPWDLITREALAGGPFAEAVRTIEDLRVESVAGTLVGVVEGALRRLGLLEVALLRPAGDRRAANLRKVVEVAREMDRTGRHGLHDLLRHVSALRAREVAEPDAPTGSEAEDVVRILTVHAAKGLEWPVVVLADVGRQFRDRGDPLLHDGDGGVAARLKDPLEGDTSTPGGWMAVRDREKRLESEELRRLLYVATTRAEERLVVTGWCKGRDQKSGRPKGFFGWGRWLLDALGRPAPTEDETLPVGEGEVRIRVTALDRVPSPASETPAAVVVADSDRARAEELLAAADLPVAPLGGTRFVVTVSELLRFAESPARFRAERLLGATAHPSARAAPHEPDEPSSSEGLDPDAERRAEKAEAFDEGAMGAAGADRSRLGRAVHAAIESVDASGSVPDAALRRALEDEFEGDLPDGAEETAREMVSRFLASEVGRRTVKALASSADVRRELGFHARIKFPRGVRVGPFDSLLVKGSIDLWLPSPEGVLLVDHKTNPPGDRSRTPADLVRRYGWQLRLYALAAERILGSDVAGARLLLLDPGWGPRAVEAPVDVSGPALEEARSLCQAFAIAELEGRWPQDFRSLLLPQEVVSA